MPAGSGVSPAEIAFGVRRLHGCTAVGGDTLQRVVHALDVDVWMHARFAANGCVRDEMADHMPGAILEARIRSGCVHRPSKDLAIEAALA